MARHATGEMDSRLRELASPIVGELGLEVVETALGRRGRKWHFRLDIDRAGPDGVGLDDCATVSRALEEVLEESDLFDDTYVLEVSSPGLDRPIRTADDVRRNRGRRVEIETREPVGGRRAFRGVLLGTEGDDLVVDDDDAGETRLDRGAILKAHQEIEFR